MNSAMLLYMLHVVFGSVTLQEVPYLLPDLNEYIPPERSVDSEYPSCTLPLESNEKNMGVCVPREYFQGELAFCGEYVTYSACVPVRQPLWEDWNATTKDNLLQQKFKETVDMRIIQEMTKDQDGNFIQIRFAQNLPCIEAFKRAICWANFPSCGDDGTAFPVCKTACQDYMTACKYSDFAICDANPSWPLPASTALSNPQVNSVGESDVIQCTGSSIASGLAIGVGFLLVVSILNNFRSCVRYTGVP